MNRCIVYASSGDYKIVNLHKDLREHYDLKLYRDVVHLKFKNTAASQNIDSIENIDDFGHVFIFNYGTVVFWFMSDTDCNLVLEILEPYLIVNSSNKIEKLYSEDYSVEFSDQITIAEHTIYLSSKSILDMLAISYGLSQSEKLGVFEYKIDDLISEIHPLYDNLGKFGKIALSRRKISQMIGQLFSVRSFINLHMCILDTPDFFWEAEELEPTYNKAIRYLELKQRTEALNDRMSIIQELYDVLHNELQTKHSHRLEWIIIILILIEVVFLTLEKIF